MCHLGLLPTWRNYEHSERGPLGGAEFSQSYQKSGEIWGALIGDWGDKILLPFPRQHGWDHCRDAHAWVKASVNDLCDSFAFYYAWIIYLFWQKLSYKCTCKANTPRRAKYTLLQPHGHQRQRHKIAMSTVKYEHVTLRKILWSLRLKAAVSSIMAPACILPWTNSDLDVRIHLFYVNCTYLFIVHFVWHLHRNANVYRSGQKRQKCNILILTGSLILVFYLFLTISLELYLSCINVIYMTWKWCNISLDDI